MFKYILKNFLTHSPLKKLKVFIVPKIKERSVKNISKKRWLSCAWCFHNKRRKESNFSKKTPVTLYLERKECF
jgi:hypothetical protein